MNSVKQSSVPVHKNQERLNCCWWMEAGVIDYKLCDREYDCEHCPFDQVLRGKTSLSAIRFDPANVAHSNRLMFKSEKAASKPLTIESFKVDNNLFYHPRHTWAHVEKSGLVRVGLDDFGQSLLGRAYSVALPTQGATVRQGKAGWRSLHQAGDTTVVSPVSGRVEDVNTALTHRPALLNRDPYGVGWVLLIRPSDLKASLKQLLYGHEVSVWYERELEKLIERTTAVAHPAVDPADVIMNDGGRLRTGFMRELTAEQMRQVINDFFPLNALAEAESNNAIILQRR